MIRQFTFIPALLGIAALAISACSAELGETGSGSGSGSSNSSSQSTMGGVGSLSGKIERVFSFNPGGHHMRDSDGFDGSLLLDDGSLVEIKYSSQEYFSPVEINNIKRIPNFTNSPVFDYEDYNLCALTHSNDVYCWGTNEYGQVGNGTFDNTFKEEKKLCVNTDCSSYETGYTYNAFKILTEVQSLISLNYGKTYCAQSVGGDAYCWGKNNGFDSSGVSMVNAPVTVDASKYQFTEASEDIVKVEGGNTSCEITDSGKVTCQGDNSDEGMLFGKENKAFSDSVNPIEITGIEKAQSFVGDGGLDFYYVCVLRTDDKIQCWGDLLEDGVLTYTP